MDWWSWSLFISLFSCGSHSLHPLVNHGAAVLPSHLDSWMRMRLWSVLCVQIVLFFLSLAADKRRLVSKSTVAIWRQKLCACACIGVFFPLAFRRNRRYTDYMYMQRKHNKEKLLGTVYMNEMDDYKRTDASSCFMMANHAHIFTLLQWWWGDLSELHRLAWHWQWCPNRSTS